MCGDSDCEGCLWWRWWWLRSSAKYPGEADGIGRARWMRDASSKPAISGVMGAEDELELPLLTMVAAGEKPSGMARRLPGGLGRTRLPRELMVCGLITMG